MHEKQPARAQVSNFENFGLQRLNLQKVLVKQPILIFLQTI